MWSLQIAPHFNCFSALTCWHLYSYKIYKTEMCLRCGSIFSNKFTVNLLLNAPEKEFWTSVSAWCSCNKSFMAYFISGPACMFSLCDPEVSVNLGRSFHSLLNTHLLYFVFPPVPVYKYHFQSSNLSQSINQPTNQCQSISANNWIWAWPLSFLQRVSIARYAERCISYDRFCLTVCYTLVSCQNDSSQDHGVFLDCPWL